MLLADAHGPPDWWYLGMGVMAIGWAAAAALRWRRRFGRPRRGGSDGRRR